LPTAGQFSRGQDRLDPDIFDAEERMWPWIRLSLIALLDAAWKQRWPDWRDWARIYLAGSLASYWWGTLDFDVLVGIKAEGEEALCTEMTQDFYTGLDVEVENFFFPPGPNLRVICEGHGVNVDEVYAAVPEGTVPLGPLEMTWYANKDSWDIRNIKPYAAYDVTRNLWAVHPVRTAKKWGPGSFGGTFWNHMADVADRIQDALDDPDPASRAQRAQAEYSRIHSERSEGFGAAGGGLLDPRALQWVTMGRWGLLEALEKELHPDRPVGHPKPLVARRI
jgi:hypothetical protein